MSSYTKEVLHVIGEEPWPSDIGNRLINKRSWVQIPAIFQAPFIGLKVWNKNCGKL